VIIAVEGGSDPAWYIYTLAVSIVLTIVQALVIRGRIQLRGIWAVAAQSRAGKIGLLCVYVALAIASAVALVLSL
jgi:hypothetical protein